MSKTIPVFYIVGADPKSGVKTELAKFFSERDARDHLAAYERWHNPTVDVRAERRDDQHEAHRDDAPPPAAPARTAPPPRLKS